VGDSTITRDEYDRAVAVAEEDRASPESLDDARVRREVLENLTEERLLVQAALEMRLPVRDLRLREQVASAMSDTVTGEATAAPGDEALRAWEAAHAASFTRGGRLRVEAAFFHGKGAADRADRARVRLLLGKPLAAAEELADAPPSPVPSEPIAMAELVQSLGPPVAKSVDALAPGEVTDPIPAGEDLWVVRLAAREGGELAPLGDVRSAVLAGWRAEEGERRLRRWLAQRRAETRVVVSERLP
jgi:hypothetical protein